MDQAFKDPEGVTMAKFLYDNWFLIMIVLSAIILAVRTIRIYSKLPSEEQLKKVKAYLLFVVLQCEKELGKGTGKAKLSMAYSMFVEHFPSLVPILPFEVFSRMVDEVLVEMRNLLETNIDIKAYVED